MQTGRKTLPDQCHPEKKIEIDWTRAYRHDRLLRTVLEGRIERKGGLKGGSSYAKLKRVAHDRSKWNTDKLPVIRQRTIDEYPVDTKYRIDAIQYLMNGTVPNEWCGMIDGTIPNSWYST